MQKILPPLCPHTPLERLRALPPTTLLLLLAFLIGWAVRLWELGATPYGLNLDEASLGYDAYADMAYGMDRNGDHLAVYAKSWGSGQNMGYNYLVRSFFAMFGVSTLSLRLPMCLLGCAALPACYCFVQRCANTRIALTATFLLAICPWHIMLSRWALEANLLVPLLLFAALCFAKALERPGWLPVATALCALCLYAYSASLVFMLVFLPLVLFLFLIRRQVSLRWLLLGIGTFFLVAAPYIAFMVVNLFDLPSTTFLGLSLPRLTAMRYGDTMPLLSGAPFWATLWGNIGKLAALLCCMNDGLIANAIPGIGALYVFLLPAIGIGLGVLCGKRAKTPSRLLLTAWLLACLVQALTIDININRLNTLFLPLVVLSAYGLVWLWGKAKALRPISIAALALAFCCFCGIYFGSYNQSCQWMFYGGLDEALDYAFEETQGQIYCTDSMGAPFIVALFSTGSDPKEFIATVDYADTAAAFRHVYSYGRLKNGLPDAATDDADAAYILDADKDLPGLTAIATSSKTFGNYTVYLTD